VTQSATDAPTQLPYETASWGRRMLALFVDWLVSALVVVPFVGPAALPFVGGFLVDRPDPTSGLWVLLVFLVESSVLTCLAGGSFGKLATRLRTVRVTAGAADPRPLDPLRTLARQVLIALVIPPLVFRPNGRGLHDIAASTASVTLATYRSHFLHKG